MKSKGWEKKDHTGKWLKINLRRKYLPKNARVLDLFCGNGEIYREVYKGNVDKYMGIDKEKIHNQKLCVKTNNLYFVSRNNINDFNVFDLDDWGSPWKLFYLILKKWQGPEAVFFITDGLKLHQNVDGNVTKWVSATEKIPCKFNIPGLNRCYVDIFGTMLLDVQKRFNCKIKNPIYLTNDRKSVFYWYLKLNKVL
jgi:SAM-dependent methyltransferase